MQKIQFNKPIIGLCAYSGSGKTTLLEKLIPILNEQNIRIAVIKHAHHAFDIDHPEKDSYKIRKAGAQQILISSKNRWALMHENKSTDTELSLQDALKHIVTDNIDLVIVEGYKASPFPKIEIYRPELGKPLISENDENIIAVATDMASKTETSLPKLDLNNSQEIATFIQDFFQGHVT